MGTSSDDLDEPDCEKSCNELPLGDVQSDRKVEVLQWLPGDKENPYNWSFARKWFAVSVALFGTLLLPLNGTSITIAAVEINKEFHISDTSTLTNSYWTMTSWTLGGAFFCIVGLPLMEEFGVRASYLSTYVFFYLMIIPQAVAPNFATLVVTRFFSGGCVTFLANTLCSMIPDLWEGEEARSLPIGLYVLVYVLANTLGPPLFAPVTQLIGNWRWCVATHFRSSVAWLADSFGVGYSTYSSLCTGHFIHCA